MRAALGKNKVLAAIAVRAGAEKVSFGGVPVAGLREFAEALANVELPAAAKGTGKVKVKTKAPRGGWSGRRGCEARHRICEMCRWSCEGGASSGATRTTWGTLNC